ncbi:hypothetical protein Hamer_G012017 [Homarus americanus]|uniref:Mutator-like transposase domain-containing protein n=1 Tax=Homarus americanus TaxID=6706 RepID=A0A8J5MLR1_HOMAM|nr:hypothetical protein Hamer_G012017 [Homarus americanus]
MFTVTKYPSKRLGRPRKKVAPYEEEVTTRPRASKRARVESEDTTIDRKDKGVISTVLVIDDGMSEGLHMSTSQVHALGALVACRECGEAVRIGVRPTTKGMISEFTVSCTVCEDHKSTNTPNLIRERKRKREKKDIMLQKTENINYAHVAAYLDNGLGYSGLRHYCKYFNARCLNEATFIVYARQVISDVVADTEESLLYSAGIVREVFKSQLETDGLIDLTVAFTTTYHQWGSDFCLVAGAVIELTTGLVLDYDVANMYCHVCKINAKKIVSMSPTEMTEWFNKHQDTCEIREWCDELDHDAEEGVREIEPKYLECFVAKKIWSRSIEKYGFRYTTLIHESDEKIHEELSRANVYEDIPILIDSTTSCFSRRKSEHARTSFQTKLKGKCPRERVQTKDRIMYVYAMSIPEYNKFAISSNIKLRQLVKELEGGSDEPSMILGQPIEELEVLELRDVKNVRLAEANGQEVEDEEAENAEAENVEAENVEAENAEADEEQDVDDPEGPVDEVLEEQEEEEAGEQQVEEMEEEEEEEEEEVPEEKGEQEENEEKEEKGEQGENTEKQLSESTEERMVSERLEIQEVSKSTGARVLEVVTEKNKSGAADDSKGNAKPASDISNKSLDVPSNQKENK